MAPSVFIKNLASTERDRHVLVEARRRLIDSLPTYLDPGPMQASTVYVWPSASCPVGCGHCNFAIPKDMHGLSRRSIDQRVDEVLAITNGMKLWKAVLSGGGEPMVEPDFCAAFVAGVQSPDLEEIELITSAHFADTDEAALAGLRQVVTAWRGRPESHRPRLTVRISLDWFHAARIGVGPAARVIRLLGHPEFADVHCYVRSVLLDRDDTIERLAVELGGQLGDMTDYQRELKLGDGRSILVYFKNLIMDGRMNERKLARLPVSRPAASEISEFGARFQSGDGRHVPARTYNGPTVKQLDGLACMIEDDGAIKILEGTAPDRVPLLGDFATWDELIHDMYRDPITVFLVEHGPEPLARLITPQYPELAGVLTDKNELYHLVERLLADPAHALYATLQVLDVHSSSGRITPDPTALAAAWSMWGDWSRQ